MEKGMVFLIRPECAFFLFGMGERKKYVYKCGKLYDASDWKIIYSFDILSEEFYYDEYTVVLTTKDGKKIKLYENEEGFFVDNNCLTKSKLNLPSFEGFKYRKQLRILLHETLYSIKDGKPLPNIFVYDKPWYRDSALMCMVLEKTDNLHLIKDWALSVNELYDRNNAGNEEPDNLGEMAYILSMFVDKNYPQIKKIYDESKRITKDGLLSGITDFCDHRIYSSIWLKYAFDRLGIDTSYLEIPSTFDDYAMMFWMGKEYVKAAPKDFDYDELYPYLWWAKMHFMNLDIDEKYLQITYPMSWEIKASQADYEKICPLSSNFAKEKCGAPHSWHSSEMFLYLHEKRN